MISIYYSVLPVIIVIIWASFPARALHGRNEAGGSCGLQLVEGSWRRGANLAMDPGYLRDP